MDWIPFGKVVRAHGVRGEIRIKLYGDSTDLPEGLSTIKFCLLDGSQRQYPLAKARPMNVDYLLTLDGVADRDLAAELGGAEMLLPADALPGLAEGEFYLFEVLGCDVYDAGNPEQKIGVVKEYYDHGAQDLIEIVDAAGGEKLLPLNSNTIDKFDRDNKCLLVHPIPGLWDEEE